MLPGDPARADACNGDALSLARELAAAAEQATLLRLGLSSGLLARCVEPITTADLATAVHARAEDTENVCHALVAFGVLQRVGCGVQLTSAWSTALWSGAATMVERVLRGGETRQQLIGQVLTGSRTYWDVDPGQRRAVAESVALAPTTEYARRVARGLLAGLPEVDRTLEGGGSWLELGCGVAGMLLSVVQIHPHTRAVGVERAPDLVELARADVERLDLGERVRIVVGDATTYVSSEPFDVVFWSQFSFPRATRQAALANAFACLRPGGVLLCPVLPADDGTERGRTRADQQIALAALLGDRWGSPVLPFAEAVAEIAAAGFVDLPTDHRDLRGPLVARKPI